MFIITVTLEKVTSKVATLELLTLQNHYYNFVQRGVGFHLLRNDLEFDKEDLQEPVCLPPGPRKLIAATL